MNFFWDQKTYKSWVEENGFSNDEDIYCLDLNEAMIASEEIFRVR